MVDYAASFGRNQIRRKGVDMPFYRDLVFVSVNLVLRRQEVGECRDSGFPSTSKRHSQTLGSVENSVSCAILLKSLSLNTPEISQPQSETGRFSHRCAVRV